MAKKTARKKQPSREQTRDDDFDPDTDDMLDPDYLLMESTLKDRERSKIQRQMKARRELERRRDEQQLKALINDIWQVDDVAIRANCLD
jgi:hypothetical protein